jgi:hypothetical protein
VLHPDKLKQYIKQSEYKKCIKIVREEIIECITSYIKEKNKNFKYTDIIDLENACKRYLDDKYILAVHYLDTFGAENIDDAEELNRLLSIYEKIKSTN